MDFTSLFKGKPVLVAGGLGFIGSNLTHRLLQLGARVTILDSMILDHGANLYNINEFRDRVQVNLSDLRDPAALSELIPRHEFLFNLAGQVSHRDSMSRPLDDLFHNVVSQLSLLEACRQNNPEIRIVFASTRQLYGRPHYLPVNERHPLHPTDVNGVNKMAAEHYHRIYHEVHGLRTVSLRLSNVYGPRQLLRHSRQGFIADFIRRALLGEPIQLFGDGKQRRDLTHVFDVVEAFLLGAGEKAQGQVYNVGNPENHSLLEIAELLIDLSGSKSAIEMVPFPADYEKIDIGSFATDISKIQTELGWQPQIALREGLAQTLRFYRQHLVHYLDQAD